MNTGMCPRGSWLVLLSDSARCLPHRRHGIDSFDSHEWRRPRQRVHPAKPKVGIRASRPNEIWHVDTTLIRLLDGSRAYLHALVDNFYRRILAWNVAETFHPGVTAQLLT